MGEVGMSGNRIHGIRRGNHVVPGAARGRLLRGHRWLMAVSAGALVVAVFSIGSARAALTDVSCSDPALVSAIEAANASPDADTLRLAAGCLYSLTAAHGLFAGPPVGLPVITTPIEIRGRGA